MSTVQLGLPGALRWSDCLAVAAVAAAASATWRQPLGYNGHDASTSPADVEDAVESAGAVETTGCTFSPASSHQFELYLVLHNACVADGRAADFSRRPYRNCVDCISYR